MEKNEIKNSTITAELNLMNEFANVRDIVRKKLAKLKHLI